MIRNLNEAQIWNTSSGQLLAQLPHPEIQAIDINRTGDLAITVGAQGRAVLWDLESVLPIQTFEHSASLFSVTFSPDASRFVVGARAQIWIWETQSGQLIDHIEEIRSGVLGIDNLSLATKTIDRTPAIWNTDPAGKRFDLLGSDAPLEDVSFSPQGDWTIGGGRNNIWFWDTASGELQHQIPQHQPRFSPDGSLFLTRKSSSDFQLWESRPLGDIRTFTGHRSGRYFASYSPNGQQIAAADAARITLYTNEGTLLKTLEAHEQPITSMSFSPDSRRFITSAEDNRINLWDPLQGNLLHTFTTETTPLVSLFTPPNNGVFFIERDGTASFLSADLTEPEAQPVAHTSSITSFAIHPREAWIATGGEQGDTVITETESKQVLLTLRVDEPIASLAFIPQEQQIFIGTRSGPSYVFDLATGKKRLTIETGPAWAARVSPDGQSVLIAGATLWDLKTGRKRYSLSIDNRLGAEANGIAFSADGRLIAGTGSLFDATARVWHAATGKLLYVLDRHEGTATAIEFSPDSQSLLTSASDGRAMIWNVAAPPVLQVAPKNDQIEIRWDLGTLETSLSPAGPWISRENLSSPAVLPSEGSQQFFRAATE